jgi:hypothetical protein
MTVDARIKDVFSHLESVWRSRQYAQMREFWVKDLPAPLYLPEERKEFITTWAEFDAYFAGNAKMMKDIIVTYQPITAVPLSATQQIVAFGLEWTTQLVNEAKPIGGSVRGIAVVEDVAGTFKLRAYIEAPLAPIMYMRELYEIVAKDRGFQPIP